MSAIELLAELGANPNAEVDPQVRAELLAQLEQAPKIQFIGIAPAEDEPEEDGDESEPTPAPAPEPTPDTESEPVTH